MTRQRPKPDKGRMVPKSITFAPRDLRAVDRLARRAGLTRSAYIGTLVQRAAKQKPSAA